MNTTSFNSAYADDRYELPPLPYRDSALEPLMCAETLYLHHARHHAAYVAGANAALKCSEWTDKLCTQYCQKLR